MREYIKPEAEIHNISAEDVITTSELSANSITTLKEEMGLSDDYISIVNW